MEYKFIVEESDYLTHQLYNASRSEPAMKRRRRGWITTTVIFFLLALLFYTQSNTTLAYYFLSVGMLSLFLYPLYSRWKYKRHYQKHIREQFSSNFGMSSSLSFEENHMLVRDTESESKISYAQFETISNLPEHYLIRLKNGHTLILPKSKVNHPKALEQELFQLAAQLNLPIKDESHWKWR